MKRKALILSLCLFGFLACSCGQSQASVYYTVNGCRCSCPPPPPPSSSFTVYSPYGSFSITDEYYFGNVSYRIPPRSIGRRPAPPPPGGPRPGKTGKPGNPPPPPKK